QAAILDLYDPDRLKGPHRVSGGAIDPKAFLDQDTIDAEIAAKLKAAGSRAVLLTGTISGPARRKLISEFQQAFPGLRHVQYDPFSQEERANAREVVFGDATLPTYHFDKSEVTVLLGADPMAEGPY